MVEGGRKRNMNRVESAGLTDIGRKRKINQDALFLDDRVGLYVVADGMGGHKAGEVASRIVVETLRDSLTAPGNPAEDGPKDASLSPAAGRLMAAIHLANREVYQTARGDSALHGMGSTVSAVFLINGTIIGANVGDSPIYLIHQDQIEEISVPHTLAAQQAAAGMDTTEALGSATHHILTQAVGVGEAVSPHICEVQGFPGDILVIGSDGLTNKVSKEEILKAARSMTPDAACRYLIALANKRGGEDNITVLISKTEPAGLENNPVIKPFIQFFRSTFAGFRNKR
jgi:protein phosphatase